jgi:hypothetical protein
VPVPDPGAFAQGAGELTLLNVAHSMRFARAPRLGASPATPSRLQTAKSSPAALAANLL